MTALQISLSSMMYKVRDNSEESVCEFVKIVNELLTLHSIGGVIM